ncbi:formimidoylglutamase [Flavobacterium sp.]|uniref:formimidoylglutamase n=1 Tax=Flavobacterium sp. TaxID=239 RepID=UPI0025C21F7D|nr:formimidoylglutamase [Flavobacterium sp.]MBA4154892.1 arginase [Flavobacterium sp.]
MAFDFLEPVSAVVLDFVKKLNMQSLGKKVVFHTKEDFPDLNTAKIAIIGVLDNRGNSNALTVDLDFIRKEFYALFPGNWESSIIDLGDIPEGNTQEDTYYAVAKIVSELIKKQILPIILGGSQDLTYAMYRGYDQLDQMVNLVAIDSKFDFGKEEVLNTSESFLSKIIINEPTNLFNYSNVGFQTYFNSQEEIDLIEKLYFDCFRLGEVSASPAIAEPVFRDCDLVSLDLTAVKSSDSGNFNIFTPNGFNGKEICALSRYAGLSDKVTSFGIFNQHNSKNESVLIAQIIWYFIEGYNYRSLETPNQNTFLKYIVPIDDLELIFFKSPKTERWWIEIPFFTNVNNKLKKNTLLPCTHEDYLRACDQEIPDRWWKVQRKNLI